MKATSVTRLAFYKAGALPYFGWLVKLVVVIWGLGALALTLYTRTRRLSAAA